MAYVATDKLLVRLREVLEAGAGSLRTITAGTFGGNLPASFSADAEAVRAIGVPQVEAEISEQVRHPSQPPILSNVAFQLITITVRVVRRLGAVEQLDGAARDVVKAAAAADSDVIRQALEWPAQMRTTDAGEATGLVSGLLTWVKSATAFATTTDDGTAIVRTEHTFTGSLRSAPATS